MKIYQINDRTFYLELFIDDGFEIYSEIDEWIIENVQYQHVESSEYGNTRYRFYGKYDAMAFKLRWLQ